MSMLKPLTEYQAPTKEQQTIISKLLSIDETLVPIIVPTQKEAQPLIKLSNEIIKFKDIKNHVEKNGFNQLWLELKLGNSIVVGKGRWNKLLKFLLDSDIK